MKNKIYDPKRDIVNTLSYKKIFNQPLSLYQLIYYGHCYFMNLSEIHEAIDELLKRNKIKFKNNKYFINNTKVKDTENYFEASKKYFDEIDKLNFIFQNIPFIQLIGVTGSLASYHFDEENDDIDLFVVCTKNRLWLTRFFLVLILKALNIYVNNSNPNLKLCPNLYISDSELSWPENKRNIYVANEIAMLQPIYQKNDTYFKFLSSNSWISEYLPNISINEVLVDKKPDELSLIDLIENFLMFVQIKIMKVRTGAEILNKNIIHFLKIDHSQRILDSFSKMKS
jgi:hypothetical protein